MLGLYKKSCFGAIHKDFNFECCFNEKGYVKNVDDVFRCQSCKTTYHKILSHYDKLKNSEKYRDSKLLADMLCEISGCAESYDLV